MYISIFNWIVIFFLLVYKVLFINDINSWQQITERKKITVSFNFMVIWLNKLLEILIFTFTNPSFKVFVLGA